MATDLSTPRSRRGVLAGVAVAAAAAAAATMTRAESVLAAGDDGSTITIGQSYADVRTKTSLTDTANDNTVFEAKSGGAGIGVLGESDSGYGVSATSDSGTALNAVSTSGFGVYGEGDGLGVFGTTQNGTGVQGTSTFGFGVYGQSGTSNAIFGFGSATDTAAIVGQGEFSTGVFGYSGPPNSGILPPIPTKTGVLGICAEGTSAVGVRGQSTTGRGGVFKGKLAQLKLTPSSAANHPSSGQAGDMFVDTSNRLWFCRGGSTWVRLA